MPQTYRVVIEQTGKVLAEKVEIAETLASRSQGLLGRQSLDPGQGLLIRPCSSIHMFFMKFPIDAIFLSNSYKVVKISHALLPWRLSGCLFGCAQVLELCHGAAKESGLSIGNTLKLIKN